MSLTSWVIRKFGGHPPIWTGHYSRLAGAEFDEAGFVTAFVYAGRDPATPYQSVRRWERDRGMVWEIPCERENWDALPVHDGAVIFRTPDRRLIAADMKSGEIRWGQVFTMVPEETPRLVDGDLLYLGKNGNWLRVDPSTGENKSSGRLASTAEKPSLLDGTRLAVSYLFSGNDDGAGKDDVLAVWPADQAKQAWAGVLALIEERYHCRRHERWLVKADPVASTVTLVMANEASYDKRETSLAIVNPFTREELWRQTLGPYYQAVHLDLAHDLGRAVALHVVAMGTGKQDPESCSVTFIVDLVGRRFLGELSAERQSWIALANGEHLRIKP